MNRSATSGPAILVGDIGGTHARFAIAQRVKSQLTLDARQSLRVADFADARAALGAVLARSPAPPQQVCLAVAGPVRDGVARLTNADWSFDAARLEQQLGLKRVHLVNDFAAQARGAVMVSQEDLLEIAPGLAVQEAPIIVLGPGTGLGLAALIPVEKRWRVVPGEGGHVAFAPADDGEAEILSSLRRTLGYVSFEAVASGIGLETVWTCLRQMAGLSHETADAARIAAAAAQDPLAERALGLFFSALGTFAGDMALAFGARGGVLLTGGILPKQVHALTTSRFLERFRSRGPMSGFLANVPVKLILHGETALLGAAALAEEMAHAQD
jgi:glucokinase